MTADRTAVATLWEAHRQAAFSPRLRGADVAGVDMVLVDAAIAGCVTTWLDRGSLDDGARAALLACRDDLAQVALDGEEAAYCTRLLHLAMLLVGDAGS